MAVKFDLGLYHFKSYKNGQFEPTVNYEKGEIAITFECDGTNDVYIIPMFTVETFFRQKNYKLSLDSLNNLIDSIKLDYKSCLEDDGKKDIDLNEITIKYIEF